MLFPSCSRRDGAGLGITKIAFETGRFYEYPEKCMLLRGARGKARIMEEGRGKEEEEEEEKFVTMDYRETVEKKRP